MKFVSKIMKSKYFGPVVSTILVILAMYVLYRLFNNATEGLDGFDESIMKSNEKLKKVVQKILQLGPQKLKELVTSIPQDIQNIMKEEDITFQELAKTLQADMLLLHMNHHRSIKDLSMRVESEKIAKQYLINDIKQYGSQQYYDSGELIFYDKGRNTVIPNYDNTNWKTRFNSVYNNKKSKFNNSKRSNKYNDIVDSYVKDKSLEMESGKREREREMAAQSASITPPTTVPTTIPTMRPPTTVPTTVPTMRPSPMRQTTVQTITPTMKPTTQSFMIR